MLHVKSTVGIHEGFSFICMLHCLHETVRMFPAGSYAPLLNVLLMLLLNSNL